MFGVNSETIFVSLIVCFAFIFVTHWIGEEAKNHPGSTGNFLGNISWSLGLSNSIVLTLAGIVLIGLLIDILSGGTGKKFDRIQANGLDNLWRGNASQ